MFFQKPMQVSYFDCDQANNIKISALMRYMEQVSSEQLEALNMSAEKLVEENMVFLLNKSCVKVNRMPRCMEKIVVGTAPVPIRGPRFLREFIVDSVEGERLVSALTLWLLVDPASHKIMRPKNFPYALPIQEPTLEKIIDDVPVPKAGDQKVLAVRQLQVGYSHLDVNRHVNNAFYGDFTCDALPFDELIARGLDTVVINFQREAVHNEILRIETLPIGEGGYLVHGLHPDGKTCFESYVKLGSPV